MKGYSIYASKTFISLKIHITRHIIIRLGNVKQNNKRLCRGWLLGLLRDLKMSKGAVEIFFPIACKKSMMHTMKTVSNCLRVL